MFKERLSKNSIMKLELIFFSDVLYKKSFERDIKPKRLMERPF